MTCSQTPFYPAALIPVYNHHQVLAETVTELTAKGLPVILVDDGSDAACKAVIAAIADRHDSLTLVTRPQNGGKGAAIKDGLRTGLRLGYSHLLQIDADGQHDREDVASFLAAARSSPEALIAGYPRYDDSIPRHRLYGRYASHVWVWINTLSTRIRDSMCGFRVYPVTRANQLLDRAEMGNRMDFDGEFIVRWFWQDWPVKQLPTRVTYPADGISHFRLWQDNGLISWMHARLFFGMLWRLPVLLGRKCRGRG